MRRTQWRFGCRRCDVPPEMDASVRRVLQVADFMAAGGGARLGDMQQGWTLLHRFVIDRKYARPSPPLGLDCGERTRRVHLSR